MIEAKKEIKSVRSMTLKSRRISEFLNIYKDVEALWWKEKNLKKQYKHNFVLGFLELVSKRDMILL